MQKDRKNVQIYHKSSVLDNSLVNKQKLHEQLERMREQLGPLNSAKQSTCSLNETSKSLTRRSSKMQTNRFSTSFLNKNKLGLRKVLEQQKVKNIIRNFRTKLKRNLTNSQPVEYQPFEKEEDEGFWMQVGYKPPMQLDVLISVLSIALILIICFIYPLDIVFRNFMEDREIIYVQIICVFYYLFQIGANFMIIKNVDGRKLIIRKEIFFHYLRSKFSIDFICLVILFTDMIYPNPTTRFLRLCVLSKAKECFQKLQKIQNIFINNFYKEQYWALAKVFLVNFAFAHCLAILLIAMSGLSPQNNWLTKIQAINSPWYQQYIWAYYWGCTIMLTVGFGDITASNYKEALCITLIETFSCILLAYNINCVGNLINNIRQQDIEKNKNFKIMRRLAQENNITEQLETKVNNYIDQSDKMKKKFGFEAEKNFVCNLPQELKADFLKQSNIKVFENLRFFSNFTEKTLLALAEFIEIKIAHPQQVILKIDNRSEFIILKEGEVGYCTKRNGFQFNGTVIDLVKVSKKAEPVVLDLNFLRFQPFQAKFQIKAINYAMIYKIPLEDLIETLKNSILDFQSFCESKQKSRHVVDEYEVIVCPYCPTKHSKMRCPKLHYLPLSQLVIYKYLEEMKRGANKRIKINRFQIKSTFSTPLKIRKHFKKLQQQIYKGSQTKSTLKNKLQIIHSNSQQFENSKNQGVTYKEGLNSFGKLTYEESKITSKMEKAILEKINNIFVEIQFGFKNLFWDLEVDGVQNFKFYFPSFNSSELNLDFLRSHKGMSNSNVKVLTVIKTMKSHQQTEKNI